MQSQPQSEMRIVLHQGDGDPQNEAKFAEQSMAIFRQVDRGDVGVVSKARLVSVWVGDIAARHIGANIVHNLATQAVTSYASSTVVGKAFTKGVKYGASRVEAFRRIVVQIPMPTDTMKKFSAAVIEDLGCSNLVCLAAKGCVGNAISAVSGNIAVVTTSSISSQTLDTGYYLIGSYTHHEYKRRTAGNVGGYVGTLGGTAVGAAVGTVVLPGIGSHVGAFLGSFAGGYVGAAVARRYLVPSEPQFRLPAPPPSSNEWNLVDIVDDEIVMEPVDLSEFSKAQLTAPPELPSEKYEEKEHMMYFEFDVELEDTDVQVQVLNKDVKLIEDWIKV